MTKIYQNKKLNLQNKTYSDLHEKNMNKKFQKNDFILRKTL